MEKTMRNRIYVIILAFILFITSFFSMSFMTAKADDGSLNFDKTNVMDDLRSSKNFNILSYPFYESEEPEMFILNVVEYCYSFDVLRQGNYGLYLYIYNPNGRNINTTDGVNKVQMAVGYNEDGTPNNYEKFDLKFCSKSEEQFYEGLFYKFKVIDHLSSDGKTMLQRVKSSARRYDISGFEILENKQNSAIEYGVGGTYTFTGYAKGYGADINEESTLTCEVTDLETIELDVKHTFYRSQTSSLGAGHQNQLDTVYFSVPKRFIEEYGRLQRIKAEWYEYKTKEILVTSNSDLYNKASPYIGVNLGPVDEFGMQEYNESIYYSLGINAGDWGGGLHAAEWGWNLGKGYLHTACQALYYMFLVGDIDDYDPYASVVEIGGIQSNDLYQYIKRYNKTFENGRLPIKDGTISADLFEGDIDDSRKIDNEHGKIQMGYSYYDFDADVDLQTLSSWSSTSPSFWENWVNFGLGAAFTGGPEEESITVAPIQILKESDLQGTNAEISKRLLINSADVNSLKSEYDDAVTINGSSDEEKVVVLFRFATSDYYAQEVDIIELGEGFLWSDKMTSGQAYIAKESVFFDFDIIQLTFNKEGVYKVIPVVASPIDIVNDITPPVEVSDELAWWQILLAIIFLILVLWLLSVTGILPALIKLIVWIITLPFKLIGKLIKAITKKRKK